MSIDQERPPRGVLALTVDRLVGPVFWARLVSSIGIWMQGIVTAIVTFAITGSATAVGVVAGLAALPQLVLGPLAGRFADSGWAVHQIILGRLFCLIGCGVLAWGFWEFDDGQGRFGFEGLVVTSLIIGLGFAIEAPATQQVLPRLVPPAELPPATVLNLMPLTLARAVGPFIGVALATMQTPGWTFTLSAITQAVLVIVIVITPIPGGTLIAEGASRKVTAAIRHVIADSPSWRLLIGIFIVSAGAEPAITLSPSVADHLDGGADLAGLLATSFGIGAAVALLSMNAVLRRVPMRWQLTSGLIALAAGMGIMAFAHDAVAAITGMVVAGVGVAVAMSCVSTLLVDRSPAALRGRVMSLWLIGFLGARPVTAVGGGWLADHISLTAAFSVIGAIVVLGAWFTRPSRITP